MTKIQRVSRTFKYIFLLLLTFIPLTNMVFWFLCIPPGFPFPADFLIEIFRTFGIPLSAMPLAPLSNVMKFYGFCSTMITGGASMYAIYAMIRLFRLYENGFIFTKDNVHWIRRSGWALLFSEFLSPVEEAAVTYVLTSVNPVSERFVSIGIDQADISMMLVAFIILLASWIMEEGRHLEEENKRLEEEQSLVI